MNDDDDDVHCKQQHCFLWQQFFLVSWRCFASTMVQHWRFHTSEKYEVIFFIIVSSFLFFFLSWKGANEVQSSQRPLRVLQTSWSSLLPSTKLTLPYFFCLFCFHYHIPREWSRQHSSSPLLLELSCEVLSSSPPLSWLELNCADYLLLHPCHGGIELCRLSSSLLLLELNCADYLRLHHCWYGILRFVFSSASAGTELYRLSSPLLLLESNSSVFLLLHFCWNWILLIIFFSVTARIQLCRLSASPQLLE